MFPNRLSPYVVYLVFAGATSFFFTVFATLSSVYRFETAGLNPLQLVLIGTVLELTVFLFEVPTGIVADVYSRRRSVVIGMALIGAGFVLEGSIPLFASMLLAQVVWGLGATFESGAVDAWISDEIGPQHAGAAFLRAAQVGQVTSLLGVGIAVALGSIYLGLPLVVGGLGYLALTAFLLCFMPETGFSRSAEATHNPFKAIKATLKEGLATARGKPVILTIFAISAIFGASSETFDRLWEAHFLSNFTFPEVASLTPVMWFGVINLTSGLLCLVATELARRRVNTNSHIAVARVLFTINVLLMICVVAFGLAGNFLTALAFYWSSVVLRTVNGPLFRAWLNQSLRPRVRATVFSMNNQMDALGQIAGGPLLGVLATAVSIRYAFVVAGLLLLPAALLYRRSLRLRGQEERAEVETISVDS